MKDTSIFVNCPSLVFMFINWQNFIFLLHILNILESIDKIYRRYIIYGVL